MSDTDQGKSHVRLVDDQRLDIPDAAALQTLPYGYMAQVLGSVLGFAGSGTGATGGVGGCLTAPVFDTAAAPTVGVGAFTFLSVTKGANQSGHVAEVVRYDPDLGSQAYKTVNLAPYWTGVDGTSGLAWIWAKPYTVEMDADSRRKWNTATGADQAFTTKTRARTRVKFATGTTAAPAGGGWTPIARVGSWTGGVPAIAPFSCWDSLDLSTTPGAASTIGEASSLLSGGQLMLTLLLQTMRARLALHLDSTGAANWVGTPSSGLVQLDARATVLEGRPINVALDKKPYVHATGTYLWNGGISYVGYRRGIDFSSRISTGVIEITTLAPVFAYGPAVRFFASPFVVSGGSDADGSLAIVKVKEISALAVRILIFDAATGLPMDHSFHFAAFAHESEV